MAADADTRAGDELIQVLLKTAEYIKNDTRLEHRIYVARRVHDVSVQLTRAAGLLQKYNELRKQELHAHRAFYFDR